MAPSKRIECSIWSNGSYGWGLRVLGGSAVREAHFWRTASPIILEIDGTEQPFNVDKKTFWTRACGELIGKAIREWKDRHGLKSGDRVWLKTLEPCRRFRVEIS